MIYMNKDYYVKLLAKKSTSTRNELLLECLDHYNANGIRQLTECQLAEFCKIKGALDGI